MVMRKQCVFLWLLISLFCLPTPFLFSVRQVKSLSTRFKELKLKANKIEKELENLKEAHEDLKKDLKKKENELKEKDKQLKKYLADNARLLGEKQALEKKAAETKQTAARTPGGNIPTITALNREVKRLRAKANRYQRQLEKKAPISFQLTSAKVKEIEKSLEIAVNQAVKVEKDKDALQKEVSRLDNQVTKLTKQLMKALQRE